MKPRPRPPGHPSDMGVQVRPTPEQLRAALAPQARVNIEAAPGSGKTTVAAERFGLYRFRPGVDARGVLALSFTRSARQELADRVRSRWGARALAAPHVAVTFDRLHQLLLEALLEQDLIGWAYTGERGDPLDSWRGASGARRLSTGDTRWGAKLRGTTVTHGASRAPSRGFWMSTAGGMRAQLSAGVCTHDDVRALVHDALAHHDLRERLLTWLTARFQAVIVDEVYDANSQDLDLIRLFCEADLPVTLIGDGWQALYDFRGARPDLVPGLLAAHGFKRHEVTRSFRYVDDELAARMASLRAGQGLVLDAGQASECDVVLATGWDQLWKAGDCVLPVGLGSPDNRSEALMTLLLNRVTSTRLGVEVRNYTEGCFVLGVPTEAAERDAVLEAFLTELRDADVTPTFETLRARHSALGLVRRPPRLGAAKEAKLDATLAFLKVRLDGQRLISGLSVHQAKGREYDRVGLKLKPADVRRLAAGLDADEPDDRVLYVAATRARLSTVLL